MQGNPFSLRNFSSFGYCQCFPLSLQKTKNNYSERKWASFTLDDNTDHHGNARPFRGGYSKVRKDHLQSKSSPGSYSLYYHSSSPLLDPIQSSPSNVRSSPLQKNIKPHENGATTRGHLARTVSLAYFFTAIAVNLPIVLMPTIAGEIASSKGAGSNFVPATFIASVAAAVSMGGGIGKLVNGAVCQALGGRNSMAVYMTGISIVSLIFSFNKSHHLFGRTLSLMEFLWSIQWTASCVVLADHYSQNAAQFATAITRLSLMSTAGTIISKVGGTSLLAVASWAVVARVGALAALVGASVAYWGIPTQSTAQNTLRSWRTNTVVQPRKGTRSILDSFRQVLKRRTFWLVGFAYSAIFLARTADRVLGSFYVHVSGLPKSLCGGLTASCTIGFAYGLARGRIFHLLPGKSQKLRFLKHNYATAVLATLGLAICGSSCFIQLVGSPVVRAAAVAILSATAASSLSFQFYQLPSIFAKEFGSNKVRFR